MIELIEKFQFEKIKAFSFDAEKIEKLIKENEELIKKANELDNKIYKQKIEINELIKIINSYKNKIKENKYEKNIIVYAGDPYLTLTQILDSIFFNNKILLIYDEYMYATNDLIIKLFNEYLLGNKKEKYIESISQITPEIITALNMINITIDVYGDTSINQELINTDFHPYKNYIFYSDGEKYEKLKEVIFAYAEEMNYEIEIIYEENIYAVINVVNNSEADSFIVLSDNEEKNKIINELVENKKIYINKNPFN